MRKIILLTILLLSASVTSLAQMDPDLHMVTDGQQVTLKGMQTLSVTGTFINLPYQDVRNKYTNPQDIDCTAPDLWRTKVAEMSEMGMEYLVFMSVANECKAYYPSKLMDWHYPADRQSPVDAIMDEAAKQQGPVN